MKYATSHSEFPETRIFLQKGKVFTTELMKAHRPCLSRLFKYLPVQVFISGRELESLRQRAVTRGRPRSGMTTVRRRLVPSSAFCSPLTVSSGANSRHRVRWNKARYNFTLLILIPGYVLLPLHFDLALKRQTGLILIRKNRAFTKRRVMQLSLAR